MDVVTVAGLAQALEIDRVIHAHIAGALDQRFDDDGAGLKVVFGQGPFHIAEATLGISGPGLAGFAIIAIR